MELTFNDSGKDFFYRWEYVERSLMPVYELKVDNVAILKIWKNDFDHTKPEMELTPIVLTGPIQIFTDHQFLYIDLEKEMVVSEIDLKFQSGSSCTPLKVAFIETSINRVDWEKESDAIPQNQVYGVSNLQNEKIIYHFAGRPAKHIRIASDSSNSCILNNPQVKITSLEMT